jgi:hypothetical protein
MAQNCKIANLLVLFVKLSPKSLWIGTSLRIDERAWGHAFYTYL